MKQRVVYSGKLAIVATLAFGLAACGAGDDAASGSNGGANGNGGSFADAGSDTSSGSDSSSGWGGGGGSQSDASSPEPSWDSGGSWGGADASSDAGAAPGPDAGGNTNVNLGGAQDFGYFRRLLDGNIVPPLEAVDAAGFFAEHHSELPMPDCGERICLQTLLAVMSNLINGSNCTMLQLGLNSPIVADPANRPDLDLVVVVDVSGSMNSDGKMNFVNRGLSVLIDSLRDDDRIALITYSTNARQVLDLTEVGPNRRDLRAQLTNLSANGGTNLYAGLELGYQTAIAAYDSGRQSRVILLSDGEPTEGITEPDSILAMSARYNAEGIGITSIGLGTSFNYTLMRGIAERGDGNYYFLEDANAVDEVFDEELSYFTVPVAYDLELVLEKGADYVIGNVHGSRLWATTADGGRLDIPSVFLAHRESDDDVFEGSGRRGGGSALIVELMPRTREDDGSGRIVGDVATATVRFREPGTNRIVEQQIHIEYPDSPWILKHEGFFDAPQDRIDIVQKSFVMLNIYVGIHMAVDTFHRNGPLAVDIDQLEGLILAVEDYNEEIDDVDMEFNLALLRQLIDVLEANGANPPPPTWEPSEDPWPCD
jgi:Ca-activated chloride channel family protein